MLTEKAPATRAVHSGGAAWLALACIVLGCASGSPPSSPPPPLHGFDEASHTPNGEKIDVWVFAFEAGERGAPQVTVFRSGWWDETQIAPCASDAEILDAHRASFSARNAAQSPYDSIKRDVVVTTLDERNRVLCNRIFSVTIEAAMEVPPPLTGEGTTGWSWTRLRRQSFGFCAAIPIDRVTAIRISGWRGFKARTMTLAELQR
jgi:hypothetical protein